MEGFVGKERVQHFAGDPARSDVERATDVQITFDRSIPRIVEVDARSPHAGVPAARTEPMERSLRCRLASAVTDAVVTIVARVTDGRIELAWQQQRQRGTANDIHHRRLETSATCSRSIPASGVRLQKSVRVFYESPLAPARNSLGVMPLSSRKARLKGLIEL